MQTVLDPAHGGSVVHGKSTPTGMLLPGGMLEKNATWRIGCRVRDLLEGAAVLTRAEDDNPSLAQRIGSARAAAAEFFISLHAHPPGPPRRGHEVWVHSQASNASLGLAQAIQRELAQAAAVGAIGRGELAVLAPDHHAPGTAACLIEVEVGPDTDLDSVCQAVARAVRAGPATSPATTQRWQPRAPSAYGAPRSAAPPAARPNRSFAAPHGAHESYGTTRYGRVQAHGLAGELDLTDFPTNVFVVVPDAQTPNVPRQIRESDLRQLELAWDCMMRGKGLIVEGTAADQQAFRVLLRGGLSDSPMTRALFQDIACDEAHPLTMHVGRNQPGVFVDAFRFDSTRGSIAAGVGQLGHHTMDLADFDVFPRVSGNPRGHQMLSLQILSHALREARQGVLGDAYPTAHPLAMDEENAFRQEQGQFGTLPLRVNAAGVREDASITPDPAGVRRDLVENGAVLFFETWHVSGSDLTSIDYSP